MSGVQHTVRESDTIDKLASYYAANKDSLVSFNDLDAESLKPGEKIVIPGGRIPPPPSAPVARPTNIAQGASGGLFSYTPPQSGAFAFGTSAVYGGNGYAFGYCTCTLLTDVSTLDARFRETLEMQ